MFKIGEAVVYSASGVCKIEDITTKNFGSFQCSYYVLSPVIQSSATVFVPIQNKALTQKMHPVLSRDVFLDIFSSVNGKSSDSMQGEQERREHFLKILDSGDRKALILMVLELLALKESQFLNKKRLHIADQKLLDSAGALLFGEIGYVFDLSPDAAKDFLLSSIKS